MRAMGRIREYAQFSAWFVALGYVVLWPMLGSDGWLFGPRTLCGGSPNVLSTLCNGTDALSLPPLLHLAGSLTAIVVTVNLLLIAIRRSRRAADQAAAKPGLALQPRPRRPRRPLARVKPRTHFGLRGSIR